MIIRGKQDRLESARKDAPAHWDIQSLRKINHLTMPAEMHAAVVDCLKRESERLFATEGMRAFEMPRGAAIAHEVGHAIVGTAEGHHVISVEIERKTVMGMVVWAGVTNNSDGHWSIDSQTRVAEVLSRVRNMIAGVLGEMVYAAGEFRSGSSLDEVVMAQLLIDGLLQFHPDEFPDVTHPKEIWKRCWQRTALILKHNENVARDLMAKLDRTERVKGKPLKAVLRRVRDIGGEQCFWNNVGGMQ